MVLYNDAIRLGEHRGLPLHRMPFLASVASAIILVLGGQGVKGVPSAIAIAVPLLAVAGLFLTMIVRTVAVPIVHMMDAAAEKATLNKKLKCYTFSLYVYKVFVLRFQQVLYYSFLLTLFVIS